MLFFTLQSGSNGNTVYVETRGVRLLFDAGMTAAEVTARLALYGRSPVGVDGLFISHEHSDHIRSAGIYARAFGAPVFVTPRTWAVGNRRARLGQVADLRHFRSGASVQIGPVTVHTISTPHDAVDGSIFVVDDGEFRLGICTDFGHVYGDLKALVRSVDALFLESNYDEERLRNGRYPPSLKRRISGPGGHISNRESAELVANHARGNLKWLCLAHLSAANNSPSLALATHREILGHTLPIHVAPRYEALGPLQVTRGTRSELLPFPKSPSYVQLAFDFDGGDSCFEPG